MNRVLINGVASEYVPVTDRGLHYGDGVFETIACSGSHAVFIDQHLNRMQSAARTLDLSFPPRQLFLNDINCLINGNGVKSVIKLMLTRGQAKRGYHYDTGQPPMRICMQSAWPEHVTEWNKHGITLRFCETQVSLNPRLAGLKTLNRLENVLASKELGTAFNEGLLSDIDGNVIEGTMSNIFAVNNDVVLTPDLSRGGINGIMRQQVIDIAHKNNIRVEIRNISRDELLASDEIFVSNSLIGVCAVKRLEQQVFDTVTMTRMINTVLQRRIEADAKAAA